MKFCNFLILLYFYVLQGIDDADSECDLDDYKEFDFVITNEKESNAESVFQNICCYIGKTLHPHYS